MAGHWGGAVADQLAVPYADAMLVPVPAGISAAATASVADNVSDAYRHIGPHLRSLATSDPNVRVLVVGAQSIRHLFTASVSLYAGLVALALGAAEVTLVDARPGVRSLAESLGLIAVTPSAMRGAAPVPLVAT